MVRAVGGPEVTAWELAMSCSHHAHLQSQTCLQTSPGDAECERQKLTIAVKLGHTLLDYAEYAVPAMLQPSS